MAEITKSLSDKVIKIVVAALAAVFLWWGGAQAWSSGMFLPKYEIGMFTPEASGIRTGTPVRLNGMPVGRVGRVELAENSANPSRRFLIALRVEKRFQNLIHSDSTASFMTEGLLGERIVNIQGGYSGPPLGAGAEIEVPPTKEIGATDFLNAIERLVKCADLEKGTEQDKPQGDGKRPASPK